MSAVLNHRHMLPRMQQLNLKLRVQIKMKEQGLSYRHLSHRLGTTSSFVSKHLLKKDPDISVLLALSHHLEINLLEPYVNLLPETLRPTAKEKALEKQLTELQQQLAAAEKERDLYKGIVMK